jgi:methyl-accepting chemotaxis protein
MGIRARMRTRASQERHISMSPATRIAIAAGGVSAAVACCTVILWSFSAEAGTSFALIALPLISMPIVVAATAWTTAHRAIAASLEPAIESLQRIAQNDFTLPAAPFADSETAGLGAAIERCRSGLEGRQRAGKVHAAVARLMGAAIGSLADGDLSRRVTLDLPEPYRAFRDDFNATMDRLEAAFATLTTSSTRLAAHQQEIDAAAVQLRRRAEKLAERIDVELLAIETCDDREEMLQRVRHILGGIAVAAKRNMEAAERFSTLGRLVEREAAALATLECANLASPNLTDQQGETELRIPPATVPARIHSAA